MGAIPVGTRAHMIRLYSIYGYQVEFIPPPPPIPQQESSHEHGNPRRAQRACKKTRVSTSPLSRYSGRIGWHHSSSTWSFGQRHSLQRREPLCPLPVQTPMVTSLFFPCKALMSYITSAGLAWLPTDCPRTRCLTITS